ncbi:MAG: lactate racemase domain-containing protein, partial [Nitrospirae bacterium]|nr:lactate racemase domain-containing protein [Nitrospirota bacterium]
KGLKTVAIAIDDLSRPTPARQILSVVLDQLQQAGLKDNDISIVFALGTHPPLTKDEMIEKLGPSVFETFRIVQHDPHHNLLDIGLSLDGIPVRINQYFFDADIKILVGCITPHSFAGFSGGGKMIFPGLANFDIIERTHRSVLMGFKGGLGLVEGNQFREEIQTVCRQCGVDFSIDVVLNQDREISGIFAGHVEHAFREGVECARKSYRTTRPSLVDVAILNAYPKDTDFIQSENAFNLYRSIKREFVKDNGIIVLMTAGSLGLGRHSLFGSQGTLARKPRPKRWLGGRKLYIYCPVVPQEELHTAYWEGYPGFQSWDDVIGEIQKTFPESCKIAVFPYSSLQLGADDAL